jgi:hypothetical protein
VLLDLVFRVAAALAGAAIVYFLSGPAWRGLYRLAFQRPMPGWLLPLAKVTAALGTALLIFWFLVWGPGGGFGFGPGGGRGSGPGGEGPGKSSGETDKPVAKNGKAPAREKLVIELLGGNRVGPEGRYYLLRREPPAKTINELEDVIKEKADKLEVHVVFTDDSVAASHPAVRRLRDLLQQYRIPTVTPEEK